MAQLKNLIVTGAARIIGKLNATSIAGDGSEITNINAGNISSGTLPVGRGGTGATDASNARANLGITPANIGAATASHNQASNTINAMTGYSKASSIAAISTSDSLNTAIGKLEKTLDNKQNAGSYAASSHTHDDRYYTETEIDTKLNTKLNTSLKGAASGLAELDSTGRVPSSQLPSYVDDVIEGYLYDSKFYKESAHTTQITGETGKIYVDLISNKTYRWSGSAFAVVSETLALGETSTTAYRGDRGKIAYDHSQVAHAPSNAEVNQNAFSNVTVGSTTIAADSKTDTLTLVAGSNVTLTPDATNDKITISSTNTDTKVTQTAISSADYTNWRSLIWGASNSGTEGFTPSTVTDGVYTCNTLSVQPSSGTIKANVFKGNLSGNATTASQWATPRTLSLTGAVTGSATIDGSGNVSLSTSVNHTHTKSQITDLQTSLDNKLDKTSYEYNKELSLGSSGKVCIGVFPCYDSNISIDIKSTTNITYHGTLIIATQNINASGGGSYTATVYGDEDNKLASSINIQYASGSNAFSIYISLPPWSKNILHIQCVALAGSPSNIATIIDSIPSTATIIPTNAFTHTHNYAGSSSAGGAANSLSGFTNTTTTGTAIDSATQNGHVYVNGTSDIYGQSDGAAFIQAYSTSWVAQIYQDYRSGQIALRGKNNGTWQSWRKVLDSANYTSYCTPANIGAAASNHTHSYLPLSGGTLTGRLSADGKITLPSSAGAWISGMTLSNASIQVSTQQTTSSYHPYFAVKTNGNHVVNIGGLGDSFGFYGFKSGRTENATDWSFTFDVSSGSISSTHTITAPTFSGALSGNASTATKLATARTIALTGSVTGSGTFDGSGNLSIATTTNHTHSYAGSSSAGGSANSAVKLDSNAGSATQPIYFSGGKPTACSYTLSKSVPSDAKFTDTTYSTGTESTSGLTKLYTVIGTATDGTMTQNAITTELNKKSKVTIVRWS